jgi:hypothetical protein
MNPDTPSLLDVSVALVVGIPYKSCRQVGVTAELQLLGAVSALAVLFEELGAGTWNFGPLDILTKSVLG